MRYVIATLFEDGLPLNALRQLPFSHQGRAYQLLTARVGSRVVAWLNLCPHWSIPLGMRTDLPLDETAPRLECGTHRAIFRLEDGECLSGPCLGEFLTPVPVVEALGRIFFYLPRRMRIL